MDHKIDPFSGEVFIPARRNQLYANPVNKVRHNNAKAAQMREIKSVVAKILDRNLKILHILLADKDEVIITRQELTRTQFKSTHITHCQQTPDGNAMCIYDVCYIPQPDGLIKIKRNG